MKYFALILILVATTAQARDQALAWNASTNATGYNVYRSEAVIDPGGDSVWGPWQLIATGQVATTYIDTTAPDGCAMWAVTATNASAESGSSNVAESDDSCPAGPAPAPPMNTRLTP